MDREIQLNLQAYLDGELPERKARRLAEWIATDKEAQALLAELRMVKASLAGNEPAVQVSESRELYWSKIERAILRAEQAKGTRDEVPWWVAWRRFLAPAAAVALVAGVSVFTVKLINPAGADDPLRYLDVVENLSEHTESFAFRSQSENMFVVWIHDREESTPSDWESEPVEDMIFQ